MKSIILVAFAVVAIAAAVPVENVEPVKTIRAEFEQKPDGSYVNSFETENKISVEETGEVKEVLDENNKPQKVVVVRGSYAYVNPDGNQESINYFADETGYHADGPSVPKVPVPARR